MIIIDWNLCSPRWKRSTIQNNNHIKLICAHCDSNDEVDDEIVERFVYIFEQSKIASVLNTKENVSIFFSIFNLKHLNANENTFDIFY